MTANALLKPGVEYYRLVGHFEGGPRNDPKCRLTPNGAALDAYLCPAGVPTIGAGSTRRMDGSPVQLGDAISEEQVYQLAERDAEDAAAAVRAFERPLKPFQFDALVSFTQNLGAKNLRKLAPLIEAGRWEDAGEAMGEYVRAWGKFEGHWYWMALLGLKIRRFSEGVLLQGFDWSEACTADHIGMPKQRTWQPNWVDPEGIRPDGRFTDIILPGGTEFTIIFEMAKATPLPPLDQPAPAVVAPAVNAGPPGTPPSPAPAAPAPSQKPVAASSLGPAAVPATTKPPALAPSSSPVPAPVGGVIVPKVSLSPEAAPAQAQVVPPKPPPVPIPIGQQTSAVDGTRNAQEWSHDPKSMILSRRFWGLFLIVIGRLWLLKTGSNAVLGAVSDPLIMEMFGGVMVMMIGEAVQHWGKAKARRLLT